MKKTFLAIIIGLLVAASYPSMGLADPDQYVGDTSIYGGAPVVLQPNILIVVDDSGSMSDTVPGGTYDPATTYAVTNHCDNGSGHTNQACTAGAVYTSSRSLLNSDVNNITTSCNHANPRNLLQTTGQYSGRKLNSSGTCKSSGTASYLYGNYINWTYGPGAAKSKISVARDVVTNLLNSTYNVNFGLMTFHYVSGNGQGAQFLSTSVSGANYISTVKDMDEIHTGTTTNRQALVSAVATLSATGDTPLGESLVEATRYFQGAASDFSNTVGLTSGLYTSPILYGCQKNYIIFVTDGMSTADNSTKLDFINSVYGRYDGGSCGNPPYTTCANDRSHSLAGAAKYLYENDLRSDLSGTQNVITYTIGFGLGGADQEAIDLLQLTADSHHGNGAYFLAGSETDLSSAFTNIIAEINAVNTSYVAPVVPVSPENRTYSGSRVYMGFFKPLTPKPWLGNLKKYGLDPATNAVLDKNGNAATNSDGSFKDTAASYWSTVSDGGLVDQGGAGDLLQNRNLTSDPRQIYTYMGTSTMLTDPSNAFTTAIISAATLSVADDGERDQLVQFVQGIDSYDDNANGDSTDNREWMMGDILHSKPLIVHYHTYTPAGEGDCSQNKSIIYVGANDGMLHAFQDCDGKEVWAFIPPDLLPRLNLLRGSSHPYYVDSSPSVYIYDANKNGIIEAGDKVVLMIGERRGGGSADASTWTSTGGYYYALDITDPSSPKYMWRISNASSGFSDLAETWSEPKIAKMKIGANAKVVAIIGAGYDNVNEDNRYGATQTFKGTGEIDSSDVGALTGAGGTSSGASAPLYPKGRGIYVVEIASLDASGVPSFGTSGTIVNTIMSTAALGYNFSIPSEVAALDTDGDGYVDRLYVGDTGGNIWRGDVTAWTIKRIGNINPGSGGAADNGRKIFYKPSVGIDEDGTSKLYFASGDREHPLNQAVVDRLYGLWDKGQATSQSEAGMTDVTSDILQLSSTTSAQVATILTNIISGYGWYIKLDQRTGEKSLASSLLLNKVVYYTTYAPSTGVVVDPCSVGNLGTGHLYEVNYLTGESAINNNTTNDYASTNDSTYQALYAANSRATPNGLTPAGGTAGTGDVLQRTDRELALPSGMPSGLVVVITASGDASAFVGAGGALKKIDVKSGGTVIQLYWRML